MNMSRLLLARIRIPTSVHLNSVIKSTVNHNNHFPIIIKLSPSLSLSSFKSLSSSSQFSTPQTSQDSDDVPSDVTTQELKDRIDRYVKGDMEALPSIFEAILARKLSGKHEDTDDELMEEFRLKTQQDDQESESESDSDSDSDEDSDEDLTESDEELSD